MRIHLPCSGFSHLQLIIYCLWFEENNIRHNDMLLLSLPPLFFPPLQHTVKPKSHSNLVLWRFILKILKCYNYRSNTSDRHFLLLYLKFRLFTKPQEKKTPSMKIAYCAVLKVKTSWPQTKNKAFQHNSGDIKWLYNANRMIMQIKKSSVQGRISRQNAGTESKDSVCEWSLQKVGRGRVIWVGPMKRLLLLHSSQPSPVFHYHLQHKALW